MRGSLKQVEGVLIDLGGVVYIDDDPIIGSLDAIERLEIADLGVRFVTNTTRMTRIALLDKLRRIGLAIDPESLFAPARAARDYLDAHELEPHLLVHANLVSEFDGAGGMRGKAVVVGDAAEGFTYAALNEAFQVLDGGAPLIALAMNRAFRTGDGRLQLDAGPFVAALEFAAGTKALVLGKPSREFFLGAVDSLGTPPANTVMIGDDAESDVAGAIQAGLPGILVRTGKYRDGAEDQASPTLVVDDLAAAVDAILE